MKVVIIGNGVAGNTTASIIRRLNNRAEITIVSEEIHPEYSACALPQYIAGELRRRELFLRTRRDYSREGIKTVFGRKVTRINPEEKAVFFDTRRLAYDKLVIATGSKPIVLPIKGIELDGVFTLKSLGDADQILNYTGKTVVIIGSGPVGVETAMALAERGLQVYLVESLDRIMPRVFDERAASLVRDILEKRGIQVLTSEAVIAITGGDKVRGVLTDKQKIKCDMVILSVGLRPNVELAQMSGLNIGTLGGIDVTRQMMTGSRDIYAGGDCVETEDMITGNQSLSLLWHNAKRQGEVIGYNCCGIPKSYPGSINITCLDVFGTSAVSFGSIEAEVGSHEDIEVIEKHQGKNYNRLIFNRGRLIGVQAIGNVRDTGALLSLMVGKGNLNEIKQMTGKRTSMPLSPWCYRVARYLKPTSIEC